MSRSSKNAAHFLCGWMAAVAFAGFNQDRWGSREAYIDYVARLPDGVGGWTQVPLWVWLTIIVAAFVGSALTE